MTHLELLQKEGETEIRGLHLDALFKAMPTLGAWEKKLRMRGRIKSVFIAEYAAVHGYDHDCTLVYVVNKYDKIAPRFAGSPMRAFVCGDRCEDMFHMGVEPMTKQERKELNQILGK